MLWASDFTYVATWQGFVYVAFVIDAHARQIVGWRASRTATANFVLDALEQAIHQRRPGREMGLIRIPIAAHRSPRPPLRQTARGVIAGAGLTHEVLRQGAKA